MHFVPSLCAHCIPYSICGPPGFTPDCDIPLLHALAAAVAMCQLHSSLLLDPSMPAVQTRHKWMLLFMAVA